jgi:hypothetical protein
MIDALPLVSQNTHNATFKCVSQAFICSIACTFTSTRWALSLLQRDDIGGVRYTHWHCPLGQHHPHLAHLQPRRSIKSEPSDVQQRLSLVSQLQDASFHYHSTESCLKGRPPLQTHPCKAVWSFHVCHLVLKLESAPQESDFFAIPPVLLLLYHLLT